MRSAHIAVFVVGLAGCTKWGTREIYGPDREVARQLLGAPAVAESKTASVSAGFAGAGSGGTAVAGLGASAGTITIKHCVQQAQLTFEQSYQVEHELHGRGGDLGISIPMAAVGGLLIAHTASQDSDVFSDEAISPTRGYLVGGGLIAAGIAILVRSYVLVPNNKPAPIPATSRQRVATHLVESSGCGLPGDAAQRQPAVPVLRPQADGATDAAARLQQLDRLRASGAISEVEYARKRKEIVDGI